MLNEIIGLIRLPFQKDKELYKSLHNIIGVYPKNIEYYKLALIHKSMSTAMTGKGKNAKAGKKPAKAGGRSYGKNGVAIAEKYLNNERLEFLGDAVLDAIVGDIVYRHFPGKREGFLTNTRSKLVQRDTLNKLSTEMGIDKLVKASCRGSSHNSYLAGNAFEALVGALYLDHGYNACMAFMEKRILAHMINIDKMAYKVVNFKSKLIEWSQKNRINIDFKSTGDDKNEGTSPKFSYVVMVEGVEGCSGEGYSKKEAQQECSKRTLEKLRKDAKFLDEVFAAKTSRTKMEEEPVTTVPSMSEGKGKRGKQAQPFHERVYSEHESAADDKQREIDTDIPYMRTQAQADSSSSSDSTDYPFDLSDITMRQKSDEEVIAAAEAAAFN